MVTTLLSVIYVIVNVVKYDMLGGPQSSLPAWGIEDRALIFVDNENICNIKII